MKRKVDRGITVVEVLTFTITSIVLVAIGLSFQSKSMAMMNTIIMTGLLFEVIWVGVVLYHHERRRKG